MRRARILWLIVLLASCSRAAQRLDVDRLKLPPGFKIEILAQVPHARMMAFSPGGALLVTATTDGKVIAIPHAQRAGGSAPTRVVLGDLNAPHGIAFHQGKLYIAETDKVVRYDWDEAGLRATNPQAIARLPRGGGHFTRTLLFANGKLYVSAGSSCNICKEDDERRAAVMEFNPDGSGYRLFARGLRNAVGLAFSPKTQTVWVTENGRDWLGDNLPPDEINDLGDHGGDFGWPYCYGNRVVDPEFASEARRHCPSTIPAKVEIQAHSAPLGLAFNTGSMFPAAYQGDLFAALHGSWNRSVPTGYKVVRIKIGANGEPQGGAQDFITGWLAPGETKKGVWMGRPVGIVFGPDGAMYVSDDSAGVLYRVTSTGAR